MREAYLLHRWAMNILTHGIVPAVPKDKIVAARKAMEEVLSMVNSIDAGAS